MLQRIRQVRQVPRRPLIWGLILAISAAAGYAAYTFMSPPAPEPAPTARVVPVRPPTAQRPGPAPQPAAPGPAAPAQVKDPFQPLVVEKRQEARPPARTTPAAPPVPSVPLPPPPPPTTTVQAPVPPTPPPQARPAAQAQPSPQQQQAQTAPAPQQQAPAPQQAQAAQAQPPKPALPKVSVTGIIHDESGRALAILRVEGKTVIVAEEENASPDVWVVRIEPEQGRVVLAAHGRTFEAKVGGE